MISASVLSVGDELLIGDTVNTNASRIGAALSQAGIHIASVRVVGDHIQSMKEAITQELEHRNILILTGGLGPTHDDVTKEVLASLFCSTMRIDERVRDHILKIFKDRNLPVFPANLEQAAVPECFQVLFNPHGTAPGLVCQVGAKLIFALPGVPYEMLWLLEKSVMPILYKTYPQLRPPIIRYLKTAGEAESVLSEEFIQDVSTYLNAGCKLAYLPGPARVMLRITAEDLGQTERTSLKEVTTSGKINGVHLADRFKIDLLERLQGLVFSEEKDETIEENLGKILKEKSLTICTAESCTGGLLINRLTDIPGSSAYVTAGYIAYSNVAKVRDLGVDEKLIEKFGAVSKEVALAMTQGALNRSSADVAVALTGIAGPGGGSKEKPVGLVWMAIQTPQEHFALELMLTKDRIMNKERSVMIAMEAVRRTLLGITRMPYGLEKKS